MSASTPDYFHARFYTELVFVFTENPKEFLIKELEELRKARSSEADHPCLFDESNIQSVFSMLDPTGRGYITAQQYKEGTHAHRKLQT